MNTPARATSGYTLLELLGYFVVFAVIVNMASSLFSTSLRLYKIGESTLDTVEHVERVGRDFADTARAATAIESRVGPLVSDASTLVLRLPRASQTDPVRYAVFGQWAAKGRLAKAIVTVEGETVTPETIEPFWLPLTGWRFTFDGPSPERSRLVTLTLSIDTAMAKNSLPPENNFSAALRLETDP